MATLGSVVVAAILRVELRFATMQPGAQYVMICGTPLMLMWYADNWDYLQVVCSNQSLRNVMSMQMHSTNN